VQWVNKQDNRYGECVTGQDSSAANSIHSGALADIVPSVVATIRNGG